MTFGTLRGRESMFLARHGYGLHDPPHEVNYRANIWALREEGATEIVSVASVGGIRPTSDPGRSSSRTRSSTIRGAGGRLLRRRRRAGHAYRLTAPYAEGCAGSSSRPRCGEAVVDGAVYAATQGPRSSRRRRSTGWRGGEIVGMTGMEAAPRARTRRALRGNRRRGGATPPGGRSRAGIRLEGIEQMLHATIGRARRIIEEVVTIE